MPEMDASWQPPQISHMFQKFALAFKAKTFDFFAEEDDPADESDGFSLLDSAEDFITDQKVVVIKPELNSSQFRTLNSHTVHNLISSIFATVSSFEASYLQLQTAHVPFVEESIKSADKALVSHLQRLSDMKDFCCWNSDFDGNLLVESTLEAQVEENQSKLRVLETVVNRSQTQIDEQDDQVLTLKKELGEIQSTNLMLSRRLAKNLNSSCEVLLSVRVFESVLHDACKAILRFTKILVCLMRKAGWDLDLAANSVHSDIEYAKKGHNRYALLSYVSMGMFRVFGVKGYVGDGNGSVCNDHVSHSGKANSSLKQLLEHISSNPMELLGRNPKCEFSKFCERKYQELIHPTMESSIFSDLDKNDIVLDSWRSLSVFYESFVVMASSIWILHKLAFSFDPVVEIFQVERGVDFSMIYMEDVTRRCSSAAKTRPKVGFTVVPGFKIGKIVVQSQVFLNGLNDV